ncbi:MAG: putative HTH-type transcriptional regulator YobS [Acidimicrobiales bacterium]|nr:MAG: putative HTH-type transcriptional regulator YobS [Acidimicrobiales bacterium]
MGRRVSLTREQVLDAAVALANRDGFSALSISGLARALRIRPPSLYNHVSGLRELQFELALRGAVLVRELVESANTYGDPYDKIRRLCHEFRTFATTQRGLYEAYLYGTALAATDAELRAMRAPLEALQGVFADLGMDFETMVHAVRTFRGLVHGLIALEAERVMTMPVSVDDTFGTAVEIFVSGLQKLATDAG